MQITKLADTGKEVEIEVNGECLTFTRGEMPGNFWTTRDGNGYVKTNWNDLTLDEQKAVERFNPAQ